MLRFFLNKLSFIIESLKLLHTFVLWISKKQKQIRSNLGSLGMWGINKTMAHEAA
jgi:hypothetical protein